MINIKHKTIDIDVLGGCNIKDAVTEAVLLAVKEDAIVRFEFNGTPVEINGKAIVVSHIAEWSDGREDNR